MDYSIPKLLASASLLVGLASAASSFSPLYNSVIETKYGKVQGYPAFTSEPTGNLTNWKDITVWKGIPFAADTAGENRFRPPQKASSWNTTLDAKSFGNVCPSATTDTNITISEDCLNLKFGVPPDPLAPSFLSLCGVTRPNPLLLMLSSMVAAWPTRGLCSSTTTTELDRLVGLVTLS